MVVEPAVSALTDRFDRALQQLGQSRLDGNGDFRRSERNWHADYRVFRLGKAGAAPFEFTFATDGLMVSLSPVSELVEVGMSLIDDPVSGVEARVVQLLTSNIEMQVTLFRAKFAANGANGKLEIARTVYDNFRSVPLSKRRQSSGPAFARP